MYSDASLKRRCLVLSTGFYEWRHVFPIGKKGQLLKTAVKYPYHIELKNNPYFYIAGIWQNWTDKDTGENIDAFALITTKANSLMEQVHNSKKRQPTILTEDLAYEWIFGGLSEQRITEIATYQIPAEEMQACTIRRDFKEALDPTEAFTYEDLPALAPN
jgi:putative SOS response-associated peptidase YedK